MKKIDKLMSWSDMIKVNNRAFMVFYKNYPQMVLSRFISVIWNALTPYVSIWLSALVIDELTGDKDVERLKFLVLLTLTTGVVIALISALLNKWKETQNAGLGWKGNVFFQKSFWIWIMYILMKPGQQNFFLQFIKIRTAAVGDFIE